jgi:hypothetical protein
MSAEADTGRAEQAGYQPTDAPARVPLIAIAGVFALIAVVGGAAAGLIGLFDLRAPPDRATATQAARLQPPPPRLETDPAADLAAVQARARARLAGYGWADRDRGLVRIPIDRAMALQAAGGWGEQTGGPAP